MSSLQQQPSKPNVVYVTREQVDMIKHFNSRARDGGLIVGTRHDVVELVDVADTRADMITGCWFGMVIGVLPDGSAHS